jgi:two-component system sensor histidine kinase DctS
MDRPAAPAPASWQLRLPYLTLLLFLATIAALVWLTRAYDEEAQRTTLINDVLWMEQNMRFHLDRNAAQLAQLGPELLTTGIHAPSTTASLEQLLRAESGLARVLWMDADGQVKGAMPPLTEAQLLSGTGSSIPTESMFRLARALGQPAYGPAYEATGGDHHFEVHVPLYAEGAFIGTAVGVYSLQSLVVRELPWWFSERYRVSVLDSDGREIAAKSRVAPLSTAHEYRMSFEPPGHGLTLHITAYRGETRWIPVLLTASLVLLCGVILWSVWQLRSQLARRQAAEQALRNESAFRKAMEDSMITGMRARDLEGRITHVNPAFCRMTGYAADELIGHGPPLPYWLPDHTERRQVLLDRLKDTGSTPQGVELRFRRKNGEPLDVLLFEAPLIDAQGHHTGWLGSFLDITEQKRAQELALQQEERLQATSRLITMGEMASTLAHELNQPLAAIASYNSGCMNRLAGGGEIDREELRDIHVRLGRQAQRAGEIIRRVHDFVRRSEPKRIPVDINAIIRDAVELIEADARKRRIRLSATLADRLPVIDADPVMIEQIIVNLVRNGMDAMRDNPPERRTVRLLTSQEDDLLVVRVIDQGAGIPPETARRLFEPFFTTKQEGMGMGLNICRSIAELHRGRLGFEPNPEGGTIFILTLPVEPA